MELDELNEVQKCVVLDTEGAIVVTAGAGSGKTRLLTHRIAYLIAEKKVKPSNILAITFTNKAANEMKERLEHMLAGGGVPWVSTFHSMCVRILRAFGDRIEIGRNFTIFTEAEKGSLIKKILKRKDQEENFKMVEGAISAAKNYGLSPEENYKENSHRSKSEIVFEAFTEYESEKKRQNALDFDDLLYTALELLTTSKEAKEHYQERFKYIHIDEFQDTNTVQYNIAKILALKHRNIMIVGDEDQSIYSWRGASTRNFADFSEDFAPRVYKLEQNYRSTSEILNLANRVIKNNKVRIEKNLWTAKEGGEPVKFSAFDTESIEAKRVVETILNLANSENLSFSDFAILMRLNALTKPFEDKLFEYGIPYKITGGFKFYDRKEIKDILAYLRILANPKDEEAILRVVNFPRRGIGDSSISALVDYARGKGLPLLEVIMGIELNEELPKGITSKVASFAKVLKTIDYATHNSSIFEISRSIVSILDLKGVYVTGKEEDETRWLNTKEFLKTAKDFSEAKKGASVSEFLQAVSLYSEGDSQESNNCVSVATVHGAKGLEYKCVFIVGLEDGIFPFSSRFGNEAEMEEERRLIYVAITRAKERLYLTMSRQRMIYGKTDSTRASRFLTELGFKVEKKENPYQNIYQQFRQHRQQHGQQHGQQAIRRPLPRPAELPKKDLSKFTAGTMVKHARFGEGIILSITGDNDSSYADIKFNTLGVLNLSLNHAPLEVLGLCKE